MHLKTLEIAFPRVFLSKSSGEEYPWIPLISPVVTRTPPPNHHHHHHPPLEMKNGPPLLWSNSLLLVRH